MPKTSGYPLCRDRLLSYIVQHQPKELNRAEVGVLLAVSVSTAGNYLTLLAAEFPENLTYVRGILIVKSSLPELRLPPEVRLRGKEKQIEQIKETIKNINTNHLSHSSLKTVRKVLKELQKDIQRL